MVRSLARPALLLAALLAVPALAASDEAVAKPVKTVVQSVRYGRDKAALQHFATEAQGAYLLGDAWKTATDAQRAEFKELFKELFAKMAFPKVRENFKNLANISYDAPKLEGETASVASVILIHHPLRKQELKLRYTVVKEGAAWRVKDVTVLGDSMLQGIRDDQIKTLMTQGGWDRLLGRMREVSQELKSQPLK
ncbi:MAG: ABC transporter substrate-binding protein [Myxococcaceae bacterium]|nr:ABC transporter substrate-binding protein [Myxococcaceae bacterium]MCI0672401.1 ABC transporter substrate-binding protein [Myxococcaceae bacterium]